MIENWSSVSGHNFQQLWLKIQCKKFKSFLLCTVYRPPDAPISFLDDFSGTVVDSLLQGVNVVILGDLTVVPFLLRCYFLEPTEQPAMEVLTSCLYV